MLFVGLRKGLSGKPEALEHCGQAGLGAKARPRRRKHRDYATVYSGETP
ncbi:MAG: hypothetical protein JWO58_476 [Chitinophagaceae bacterium]|nr:hypothetical protein [Chitinophagaceae bacterium]